MPLQRHKVKVLLADHCHKTIEQLKMNLNLRRCTVTVISEGKSLLKTLEKQSFDLIFCNLLLPKVHGIDCLLYIRSSKKHKDTPVVIVTERALIQDYKSAVDAGASFYLTKPFKKADVRKIISLFEKGVLGPLPFKAPKPSSKEQAKAYNLTVARKDHLKFWGTRGSIPVSAASYSHHGGNTSCLEIYLGDDKAIIIDAGTGIRPLGKDLLARGVKEIHLIIGHTHWDHILGFPFFTPAYVPKLPLHIYASKGFGKPIRELFTGMLDRDYFPVSLSEMNASFNFHTLEDGKALRFGPVEIHYTYANHPGSSLCFKISTHNHRYGYATDNEIFLGHLGHPNELTAKHPLLLANRSLIDFFSDCDVLIHEAQYFPQDYANKIGWGHSSISNVVGLLQHCRAQKWVVTHHDPEHNDIELARKLHMHQAILHDCGVNCQVQMAYDGLTLPL